MFAIRRYPSLPSTNATALEAAAGGAPQGSVIVAGKQTAGRGRRGRPWRSPPGCGLYASLILRPRENTAAWSLLPILAGVAAARAIRELTGAAACLKWPNDVLVNFRKIAGILVEADIAAPISGRKNDEAPEAAVIVGIGVNISTPVSILPERPLYPASSLLAETGVDPGGAGLLDAWLSAVAELHRLWRAGETTALRKEWSGLNALRDREISIAGADGGEVSGIGNEIDEQGALLLHSPDGEVAHVVAGDVSAPVAPRAP